LPTGGHFWWYVPLLPLLLFPWFVWPGLWKALAHHWKTGLDRGTPLLPRLDAAGVHRVFLHQRQAAALSGVTVSGVCTAGGARGWQTVRVPAWVCRRCWPWCWDWR